MKTNYVDMGKRYELAERHVFSNMPAWKREAIIADRKADRETGLYNQFIKDVTKLAEDFTIPLTDTLSTSSEPTQSTSLANSH